MLKPRLLESVTAPTRVELKPPSAWSLVLGAVLFFAIAAGIGWLLFVYLQDTYKTEPFDAARTAATLLGVPSAAAAIYVGLRSQRVKEQQLHADRLRLDATERQLTHTIAAETARVDASRRSELQARFISASDQVGDDAPAVRLAGLNGLSQLADEWAEQRQACVDVICAYLRMPPRKVDSGASDRHELEVRLSVQRLIAAGLRPRRAEDGLTCKWADVSIDLRGATLTELNFSKLYFPNAIDFSGAVFIGPANFEESRFEREARFQKTEFDSSVSFRKAQMTIGIFDSAVFKDHANFRFTAAKGIRFGSAVFERTSSFEGFRGKVTFQNVSFGSQPVLPQYELLVSSSSISGAPMADIQRTGAP